MTKKVSLILIIFALVLLLIEVLIKLDIHTDVQKNFRSNLIDKWDITIPVVMSSINPQHVIDSAEKALLSTVFSHLIKVGPDLEIQPDLLERWEHDIVNQRYTLILRPDVLFHSGKTVNADDVIFSFHYWAKKENLDSNLLSTIKGVQEYQEKKSTHISGLKKIDNRTIEVSLVTWSDRFVLDLALPRFCIYPLNFSGKSEETYFLKPDGTGPYQVDEISSDKKIKLISHEKYFLGAAKIRRIEVSYLNYIDAIDAFNLGKIDNLIFYQINDTNKIKSNKNLINRRVRGYKTLTLIINPLADQELRNKSARQYLLNQIDKASLISDCYSESSVADVLIPSGLVGSALYQAGSKTIYEKQKLNHQQKSKTIYIENSIDAGCLSKSINSQLSKTSYIATGLDFTMLYSKFKKNTLSIWIELLEFKNEDPFSVLQYFWDKSSEYLIGVKIPELTALFNRIANSRTYGEKASLYGEVDQYLVKNYYVYPIAHLNTQLVYRDWIHGLSFSGNRSFLNDWHKIEIHKEENERTSE